MQKVRAQYLSLFKWKKSFVFEWQNNSDTDSIYHKVYLRSKVSPSRYTCWGCHGLKGYNLSIHPNLLSLINWFVPFSSIQLLSVWAAVIMQTKSLAKASVSQSLLCGPLVVRKIISSGPPIPIQIPGYNDHG